jgi:hypothetical protein
MDSPGAFSGEVDAGSPQKTRQYQRIEGMIRSI